jgi:hypothetical protein
MASIGAQGSSTQSSDTRASASASPSSLVSRCITRTLSQSAEIEKFVNGMAGRSRYRRDVH